MPRLRLRKISVSSNYYNINKNMNKIMKDSKQIYPTNEYTSVFTPKRPAKTVTGVIENLNRKKHTIKKQDFLTQMETLNTQYLGKRSVTKHEEPNNKLEPPNFSNQHMSTKNTVSINDLENSDKNSYFNSYFKQNQEADISDFSLPPGDDENRGRNRNL